MSNAFANLQKVGKSLMLPVSVLPVAGILLGVGSANFSWLPAIVSQVMAQAGGAVFGNMALIFAIGVALGFTNNDGVAALAATVGYAILTKTMTVAAPFIAGLDPTAADYAVQVEHMSNTGVLGGIIAGAIAAFMFNRFYRIQLPEYLGFFAGKRFVPIITGFSVILAAVILLVKGRIEDRRMEEALDELRPTQSAETTQAPSTVEGEPTVTASPEPSTEETPASTEEFERVANPYSDSFLANKDMAAWLQIPGTNIDYPVMWTPEDETYYLYRAFDGSENKNGCLLLDDESCVDPLTTNLIIHGHNMKSGAMFGNLTDYENQDFYKEHKNIILYTEECQRNYEIIAVFRSQVYRKTDQVFKFYKFFQADTQEEFDDFYNNIKQLSQYDTGVTAEFGDHFLTLSTCVYHVEQGRFVVVAKEVEPGDHYLPIQE
jgi:SrtB family sortase